MIGIHSKLTEIYQLLKYGSKPVIIGGYHGLGKTSMVYDVAKYMDAEVIRLQVTELLTDVDIIGGYDLNSKKFIYSEFVKKLLEAIENPSKQYILLIDEFTRGRAEAMECLFPVFAENMLIINSPYAPDKEIKLTGNVRVIATGNIKDRGVRDVGGAEFDRFNGVEVEQLSSKSDLKRVLAKAGLKDYDVTNALINFYNLSWEYGEEMRILPMSHRTLKEVAQICQSKIDDGFDSMTVLKDTLRQTYFVSSQALLNPNFKNTYDTMVREAL
jgi:MoxR-like ATPase